MQAADLSDTDLIEKARQEAISLLRGDPDLSQPGHVPLAKAVARAKRATIGEAH
jgi:hypothetical protein